MTLVLIDGCEDFSSVTNSGSTSVVGRYNNGFNVPQGQRFDYNLLTTDQTDTLTVGAAFRFQVMPTSGETFLTFRSDAGATSHLEMQLNANGSLTVLRPFTAIATTAASLVTAGKWFYIEMQGKLHDTTGTLTVRVDGAQVATFSGDTKNAGTKTVFDQVRFSCGFSGATAIQVDDLYIASGVGDPFLGSITVETLYPNGNGNVNQWIGSDGDSTDNYLLVDEVPHNTTDYVSTGTIGQQDLYALGNLTHTDGTIVGICHSAHVMRTDAVTAVNVKLVNRRAADNKSAAFPLGTAYRSYEYCLTVDPETGLPFTIANVNALQSGVELA